MKILVTITACVLIAACATTTTETTLKNDKGETRYCYLANDHTLVSVGAMSEYNRCLNDAGTAGFKKIN